MYKKIIYNILPFLKLRRENLKWYNKLSIYGEIVIMLWFLFWVYILTFYHLNFQEKYRYENINLYSKNIMNCFKIDKLDKSMVKIEKTLGKHKIILKRLQSDIYLVNNVGEYFMIMPPFSIIKYQHTMAFTTFDNIYFKYVNLYENKSYFNTNKEHPESFELVLSHELIHIWQKQNYGFLRFLLLSDWIKEGYAVYVTEEKPTKDVKLFLSKDFEYLDGREWYILWSLMVKHAIEKMHISVDDLHLGKVDYDEVLESLLKEHNISRE